MKAIRPIGTRDGRLSDGFLSAVVFCREIARTSAGSVSLADVGFVTPSFLLPSIVFLESLNHKPTLTGASSYIDTVRFTSGGVDGAQMRNSEFRVYISGFARKTYIPIVKFPTALCGSDKRDAILASVLSILNGHRFPYPENCGRF